MASDREVKVRFTGDASKFKKAVGEAEGASGRLQSKLAGLAAGVAAGAFFKSSIEQASNLEESLSKARNVFGDSFAEIDKWAKTAAKSVGLARGEALEAAATFGNLFQSFGVDRGKATEMSSELVKLAADLASFNNTSVQDALDALRSGLSGETEPLKRYGVALTDARLKAEALSMGLVKSAGAELKVIKATDKAQKAQKKAAETSKKYGKDSEQAVRANLEAAAAIEDVEKAATSISSPLDAATKAQAAFSLTMKDSALAQGDFAETSDGFANSLRIFQATVKDAQANLAIGLLPTLSTLLQVMTALGPQGMQTVVTIGAIGFAASKTAGLVQGVADGFSLASAGMTKFGGSVTAQLGVLGALIALLALVIENQEKISNWFRDNVGGFKIWEKIPGLGGKRADFTPVGFRDGFVPPGRAFGGPVMAGMPYRVGEMRAETFVPATDGYIRPKGGGGDTFITNVYGVQDGVNLARIQRREVERRRRAGVK